MHGVVLMLVTALQGAGSPAPADSLPVWRFDVAHSDVSFRIRHLMSRVRGSFQRWEGTLHATPGDWAGARVEVAIDAASIFTNNERRDADLRSGNFFEVARFPQLRFVSRAVEVTADGLLVHGDLTIRDVTRPVTLTVEYLGTTPDRSRLGFEATTTINRLDFGVTWNRAAEGGGLLLGDDVEITLTLEAVRI